ncbi:hypothetical protein RB195_005088 [Necator americanus]|uniref:Uncharacterized protein n=1 Tax=Necator americanus TaxID=51031 RepID=A0ABR1BMP1_NECAM
MKFEKMDEEGHSLLSLFDGQSLLHSHHLKEDGHAIPQVLPSKVRHAIMSVENGASLGSNTINSERLKNPPPLLINTLAMLFTH